MLYNCMMLVKNMIAVGILNKDFFENKMSNVTIVTGSRWRIGVK